MQEITIGIGGAAGDGLDKSGDTIAKTAGRLGLYLYAYNSYQSIIRGGHIWLRLRCSEQKTYSHGDHLNVLIALNQDTIERHGREIEPGGALLYNTDRLNADSSLVGSDVLLAGISMNDVTREIGKLPPIMQNTVLGGALLFLIGLEFDTMAEVLAETFKHKGQQVVDQNVSVARIGFDYARDKFVPVGCQWNFSRQRRPFVTGNEAFSIGAVAAGCKFYSAYPMTPASGILHWMAAHGEQCGVVVKQCEDELAVANMAIGAGYAGVRAMCGTSGGGFALMTEAIGMAGMIEAPCVFINVQRGGPSTGIPTKTEQADLNQIYGASQGDFPRVIIAPSDTVDCFDTTVEAFNLAEKFQLPVLILSDLLLSEHPESIERDALRARVPIERGEFVSAWPAENGPFQRFKMTASGVSPRALAGTPNTVHVSGTDDHDEFGILISDVFTSPPVRRKIQEKRMRKMELVRQELRPPEVYGAADADLTLITWGSTRGVVREAVDMLNARGVSTNQLVVRYLMPFQTEEVRALLARSRKTICVELNYTGQFARFLRAETGYSVDELLVKYDGEPFEPRWVVEQVQAILEGRPRSLDVSEEEAREMGYHYIRTHLEARGRPGAVRRVEGNGFGEPIWLVEIVDRKTGATQGELSIGVRTGSNYNWKAIPIEKGTAHASR